MQLLVLYMLLIYVFWETSKKTGSVQIFVSLQQREDTRSTLTSVGAKQLYKLDNLFTARLSIYICMYFTINYLSIYLCMYVSIYLSIFSTYLSRDILPGVELKAHVEKVRPGDTFMAEKKTCQLLGTGFPRNIQFFPLPQGTASPPLPQGTASPPLPQGTEYN